MMKNINRICVTLILLTALTAKPACGETNSIDFSAFYREWAISPENALEQITPALLELAASVKTNGTAPAILHNSLWNLFSTNSCSINRILLPRKKGELLCTIFIASTACATPIEEHAMGLANALTFLEDRYTPDRPFPIEFLDQKAHDAMVRKLIENGALEQPVSEIYLKSGLNLQHPKIIEPRDSAPKEAWELYGHYASIYNEIDKARTRIVFNLVRTGWGVGRLPQEDRDRIFAEIVSMQILRPEETDRIARNMKIEPAAAQAQPTPTE